MLRKIIARCLIACMLVTGFCFLGDVSVNAAAAKSKVYIGHATHDERGKIKGGAAGDQSKKEIFRTYWSYSSKGGTSRHWKYVFRAKDPALRARLASAMLKCCANDHIGYDQTNPDKYSAYKEAQKKNWKIDQIDVNCEAHCASIMSVCINAAGVNITMKLGTPNEYKKIMETGKFMVFTTDDYTKSDTKLLPGDILLSGKHTAMVVDVPASNKTAANIKAVPKPAPKTTTAAKATTKKTTAAKKTTKKTTKKLSEKERKAQEAKCNAIIDQALSKPLPKTTSAKKPEYQAGLNYFVQVPLNIRKEPSAKADIVKRSKLSKEAQAVTLPCDNAILIPGTEITCIKMKGNWMKIPSGWICTGSGNEVYIR